MSYNDNSRMFLIRLLCYTYNVPTFKEKILVTPNEMEDGFRSPCGHSFSRPHPAYPEVTRLSTQCPYYRDIDWSVRSLPVARKRTHTGVIHFGQRVILLRTMGSIMRLGIYYTWSGVLVKNARTTFSPFTQNFLHNLPRNE